MCCMGPQFNSLCPLSQQVGCPDSVGSRAFPPGVLPAVRAGAATGRLRARHAAALWAAAHGAARAAALPRRPGPAQPLPGQGERLRLQRGTGQHLPEHGELPVLAQSWAEANRAGAELLPSLVA